MNDENPFAAPQTESFLVAVPRTRVTTIKAHLRRTNRNKIVFGLLLAAFGVWMLTWIDVRSMWLVPTAWLSAATLILGATGIGMIWPQYNLILRRLSALGQVDEVVRSIDTELEQSSTVLTFGKPLRSFRLSRSQFPPVQLTPSWMLQFSELGLLVVRLETIVAAHTLVVVVNGIRSGFSVVVRHANGRKTGFGQSEAEVDRLLATLMRRLPNASFGPEVPSK